ncbi:MAG TPA: hypothetical protein VK934_12330 [Fimbriimonas sp.]|nr:hypothetical protein [Fimbriimonas sp.]
MERRPPFWKPVASERHYLTCLKFALLLQSLFWLEWLGVFFIFPYLPFISHLSGPVQSVLAYLFWAIASSVVTGIPIWTLFASGIMLASGERTSLRIWQLVASGLAVSCLGVAWGVGFVTAFGVLVLTATIILPLQFAVELGLQGKSIEEVAAAD